MIENNNINTEQTAASELQKTENKSNTYYNSENQQSDRKDIRVINPNRGTIKKSFMRKKYCRFCKKELGEINYKNIDMLVKFTKSKGKILPRRFTGNCQKHQRVLAQEIKKARYMALMPYVSD